MYLYLDTIKWVRMEILYRVRVLFSLYNDHGVTLYQRQCFVS